VSQKQSILEQYPEYEAVIGIEVHTQLTTESKIFSSSANGPSDEPNNHVDPVCTGFPGTLPVVNEKVIEYALMAGCATDSDIARQCHFDRKHYFYPDLPKGYQITQDRRPICTQGSVPIRLADGTSKSIRLKRIHMEEDAGKSIHDAHPRKSYVDLNRAGTPLLEIVSEADIRSPQEAQAYLKILRLMVMQCGICTGDMEKGAFRADSNISVRKKGETGFNTKCELKNINSFKFIGDALEYEIERQIKLHEAGKPVEQETRLWNTEKRKTVTMRKKEEAADYRYFRDPDLPPLYITDSWIGDVQGRLPELPHQRYDRIKKAYELSHEEADMFMQDRPLANYFEQARRYTESPHLIKWLLRDVVAYLKEHKLSITEFHIRPKQLAQLMNLIEDQTITTRVAKDVFDQMLASGKDPKTIVEEQGLEQMQDTGELERIVKEVVDNNPQQVEAYKNGKEKLFGFFVGQIMKQTGGTADPQAVKEVLQKYLAQ